MKVFICIIVFLPVAVAVAAAADAPSPLQPFAFLAGTCWKGDLPAKGAPHQTDEHCFSWLYGQRFLRDVHTVHADNGRPDYVGETTYYWNAASKQLQYLYIENQGGMSQGAVQPQGDALIFPETDEVEGGKTQAYRSRWQRAGADAYDVITEFKTGGAWVTAWTVHMHRTVGH